MTGTIHRAGTCPVTIKTPLPPAEYSKIRISFSQDQVELITKNLTDAGVTIEDDTVVVVLTQQETLLFRPSVSSPMGEKLGAPAFMQIRCYKSAFDAPASACWLMDVYGSINTEVLS